MSNLRQAAQQALEALYETERLAGSMAYPAAEVASAITALRAALADPEQEPVAWVFRYSDGSFDQPSLTEHSSGMIPLYTAPTPCKPPQFPTMLRKMWSGDQVQEWIDENWNK